MRFRSFVVFAVAALLAQGAIADEGPVGRVKTVKGDASVVHAGSTSPVTVGAPVALGDTLKTGKDGSIGVTLRDNTMVSIGPDTEYAIDQFVFQPRQNKLSFVSRVTKGSLHYVSGTIAKLSPDAVKVATPTGTIGVRGTRFAVRVGN